MSPTKNGHRAEAGCSEDAPDSPPKSPETLPSFKRRASTAAETLRRVSVSMSQCPQSGTVSEPAANHQSAPVRPQRPQSASSVPQRPQSGQAGPRRPQSAAIVRREEDVVAEAAAARDPLTNLRQDTEETGDTLKELRRSITFAQADLVNWESVGWESAATDESPRVTTDDSAVANETAVLVDEDGKALAPVRRRPGKVKTDLWKRFLHEETRKNSKEHKMSEAREGMQKPEPESPKGGNCSLKARIKGIAKWDYGGAWNEDRGTRTASRLHLAANRPTPGVHSLDSRSPKGGQAHANMLDNPKAMRAFTRKACPFRMRMALVGRTRSRRGMTRTPSNSSSSSGFQEFATFATAAFRSVKHKKKGSAYSWQRFAEGR